MEQKEINRMRIIHAAKILSSLCIAGAVYLLLTGAVPVLSALWKVIAALRCAVRGCFDRTVRGRRDRALLAVR